jgi:hypothetical protein
MQRCAVTLPPELVDLERRQPVALWLDREAETLAQWLCGPILGWRSSRAIGPKRPMRTGLATGYPRPPRSPIGFTCSRIWWKPLNTCSTRIGRRSTPSMTRAAVRACPSLTAPFLVTHLIGNAAPTDENSPTRMPAIHRPGPLPRRIAVPAAWADRDQHRSKTADQGSRNTNTCHRTSSTGREQTYATLHTAVILPVKNSADSPHP